MATVYPFQQLTNAGNGSPRHHDYSFPTLHPLTPSHTVNLKPKRQPEGLESRLIRFEATARKKCFAAIEGLPNIEMDGWFVRQLDSRIIPALTRIGFDELFAHLLFQTATPGWQTMGRFPCKCTLLHPALIKNIKLVRSETISDAGAPPDSSWIILPRVSHFLHENHAAYLLCYLDHLAVEPESEFRRILTRIIIEFVGNYALKFRNSILPRCLIDTALFYGYEAMFWKNLVNPPPGFENALIFNHCLRWLKLLRTKCADLNEDMMQRIEQMEAYRQKVMLLEEPFICNDSETTDLSGLLVTLRHGRPGIRAAIDFMGQWLYSSRKDATGCLVSALLPAALNGLFHSIKLKIPVESPERQKSLSRFLRGLRDSLASKGINNSTSSIESPEQFRFVMRRVLGLIDGAAATLA